MSADIAYRLPPWNSIIPGPKGPGRRVAGRWGLFGVVLMTVGSLLLSSPLLAMLWFTYDPGTHVAATDGEDGTMLAKAASYDRKLLKTPNVATGEASDPFGDENTPAWQSDTDYLAQLGEGDAMARIRIPKISVDLPIGHGTAAGTLEQGAGHIYGTTLPVGDPGNTVIAAHRGLDVRLLFYRVGELGRGDMIYTQAGGRTVAWRVDRRLTVQPGSARERRMLEADGSKTVLTLYTCDPPGLNTRRLLIQAHRVPYDDASKAQAGQTDVRGGLAYLGAATAVTLLFMIALHPTYPVMRHSSRRAGSRREA